MAHFQVDSFVTKFKHLCHAGFKATLTITSSDGEASVVLTAGLGPIPPTQLQHDLRNHVQPRPRGPAYQRRQARRQAARTAEQASAEQASAECDDVQAAAEAAATVAAEEVVVEETCEESAEQAKITFPCLICDFVSNWENGLQVHLTRMHSSMEQIDGNDSYVGDDLEKDDEKYSRTRHYWKTGRLGTGYQVFIDANDIIDNSDLTEESKNDEKEKILNARKTAFGPNFGFVPPWNMKP